MKILYKITDYRYVDYDNDIEFIRDTRILFGGEIRCWWEYKKNGKMNEYIEITDGIDFNSSNKQEKLDELDKQFFDFIRKIGYDIFKEDGSNAKIPDGKYEWEYDVDKAEMRMWTDTGTYTFTNCYPKKIVDPGSELEHFEEPYITFHTQSENGPYARTRM